jgi:hypothetical protein
VVVNLRPETDPEAEFLVFDRSRVLRVLGRIIAGLDEPPGSPPIAAESRTEGETAAAGRAHHRRRLGKRWANPYPGHGHPRVADEYSALSDEDFGIISADTIEPENVEWQHPDRGGENPSAGRGGRGRQEPVRHSERRG